MNRILHIWAVLATSLLTFVCQISAADQTQAEVVIQSVVVRPDSGCVARLSNSKPDSKTQLENYDKNSWLKYVDLVSNASDRIPLSTNAHLLGSAPAELKAVILSDLARRRMKQNGNKRNIDLMFNLMDRGDVPLNNLKPSETESAYLRYFAHEAEYFKPAYDGSLVLSVVRAIHSSLREGLSVAVGGSFINARANIERSEWDLDLLGQNLTQQDLNQLKTAFDIEFKSRDLRPPKLHFRQIPKVHFDELNMTYFDVRSGEPIVLVVAPPPLLVPSSSGYPFCESQGLPRRYELK
ncbi:MAG: hypothetical protein ACXVA9_13555 [Bdellovibrionales bacterium]